MSAPTTTPATITRAERVPGLFDIRAEDGREWLDVTLGQVGEIVAREALVPSRRVR